MRSRNTDSPAAASPLIISGGGGEGWRIAKDHIVGWAKAQSAVPTCFPWLRVGFAVAQPTLRLMPIAKNPAK